MMNAIMEAAAPGIAKHSGLCRGGKCSKPASSKFMCAKCRCRYCSATCMSEDEMVGSHNLGCDCYTEDATLIAHHRENGGAMMIKDDDSDRIWEFMSSNSAIRVNVVEALVRRRDMMDLSPLPPSSAKIVLYDCAYFGSLPTVSTVLPPHMMDAAAFSWEVILSNADLALEVLSDGGDDLERVLTALVVCIYVRNAVDPRMCFFAKALRYLSPQVRAQICAGLMAGFSWAIMKDEAFDQWGVLQDILDAYPAVCTRAFLTTMLPLVERIMAVAKDRAPRLADTLARMIKIIALAGTGKFTREAPSTMQKWRPTQAALEALSQAIAALEVLCYLDASAIKGTPLFDDVTRILSSVQYCGPELFMAQAFERLAVVFGGTMTDASPERCLVAVPFVAFVLTTALNKLSAKNTIDDAFESDLMGTSKSNIANLHKVLRRVLSRAAPLKDFPPAFKVHVLLSNVLRLSPRGHSSEAAGLAKTLASLEGRVFRKLSRDVGDELWKHAKTPFAKRLFGILHGTERACENPGCKCEEAARLQLCDQCRGVRYCSPACQAEHWPVHKAWCTESLLPPTGVLRANTLWIDPKGGRGAYAF